MKRSLFAQIIIVACFATVVDAQFDPLGLFFEALQAAVTTVATTVDAVVIAVQDVLLFPVNLGFTIAINALLVTLNTQINEQVVPLLPDPFDLATPLLNINVTSGSVCGGTIQGGYVSQSLSGGQTVQMDSLGVSNLYVRPVNLRFYGDFSFTGSVNELTGYFELDLSGDGCTATTATGNVIWTDAIASGTAYAGIFGDPLGTNLCVEEFAIKALDLINYVPTITFDAGTLGDFAAAEDDIKTETVNVITNTYNTYSADLNLFEREAEVYLPFCLQDILDTLGITITI